MLEAMAPGSELAEGLPNNVERFTVHHVDTSCELFCRRTISNFNEAGKCARVNSQITIPIWTPLCTDSATTLHNVLLTSASRIMGLST